MKSEIKKIHLLLTDDHVLLRNGLAAIIDGFPECDVIGQASNGLELIALFEKGLRPDIILLDLNMPEMDGYETAQWLKENHPGVKILVLTMYDSDVALVRLMQRGVRGIMKKDISAESLRDAIHSVNVNGWYYCNSTTGKLAGFFNRNEDNISAFEKGFITDEEIAFLKLAASEMTYKEIAGTLGISARTTDTIRDTLFEKLDVKSRVGLVIYAMKNGIVTL